MKKYFITATGTGIGKTFICCEIIKYLRQKQCDVKAIKPIITGVSDEVADADNVQILNALGEEIRRDNLVNISPFSFKYPASPDIAARYSNQPYLNYDLIVKYCQDFLDNDDSDFAFIEGIGGVMVPLDDSKSLLDLIKDLDIEIILLTGNYLGTLSHTLTALNVLEGCHINQIIVNDLADNRQTLAQNIDSLSNFFEGKINRLHYCNGDNDLVKQIISTLL